MSSKSAKDDQRNISALLLFLILFHWASICDPIEKASGVDFGVAVAETPEGHVSHFGSAAFQTADDDGNILMKKILLFESESRAELGIRQHQSGLQFGH
jgi:hypothetical protein